LHGGIQLTPKMPVDKRHKNSKRHIKRVSKTTPKMFYSTSTSSKIALQNEWQYIIALKYIWTK